MPDRARMPIGLAAVGLLVAVSFGATARAAHPILAGFERFGDDPKTTPVESGLLLLGELNCTACHRVEPGLAAHLNRKRAPILDGIGLRARPAFLRAFLNAPHATKAGTTMPDVFADWGPREKADAVEALTQFLASNARLSHARLSRNAVAIGKTLYHQVGCAVCHGSIGDKLTNPAVTVPLGPIDTKYTVPSLTAFLLDPLKSRPSGRMPALRLRNEEASQIAQFLLRDLPGEFRPNVEYRYYEAEGSWDTLPDFSRIMPKSTGQSDGFDVSVASRKDHVALRFQGLVRIEYEGIYTFFLTSDDGSRLFIDDNLVIDNGGTHPAQEKEGTYRLGKGYHRVRVEFFNAAGEIELDVDFRGPGLRRQPLAGFVSLKEGVKDQPEQPNGDDAITINPELVKKGRKLFARVGCASCHQFQVDDRPITPETEAPALANLSSDKGCLAETPGKGVPHFDLSDRQRSALASALGAVATLGARPPTHAETIARTLTALNCYACHERDGRGGVLASTNELFATTQKEMGDEGRVPPPLTGVGAKLNEAYLKTILDEGAKDRPYMLARMPRFGAENAGALVDAFAAVDRIEPVETPTFDETPRRVKSDGRFLVGGMALGCIKCHTFKGTQAEGIQAIDMSVMTRRLRHDWFHRYVISPPMFRPGTRMPTGWPDGKSTLPKLLGGDTARQVEAVWQFLSDGPRAAAPYGLGREPIPLFVRDEAVIYRNFIQGSGTRAIGVGYPGNSNLAFDANDLRIALIWQGGFIDASKHWNDRGDGFQPPMGDNVVSLPHGTPFAILPSHTDPWPARSSRSLGYHFRGYRLGKERRPTFLYDLGTIRVEDEPEAVAGPRSAGLKRTLNLTSDDPAEHLYFRAALGDSVKPQAEGWFLVNGEWKVRITSESEAFVRSSNGQDELLVPVKFAGKTARIVEEFEW